MLMVTDRDLIPFLENSEIINFRQKAEGRGQKLDKIKVLCCHLIREKAFKSPVTFENCYNLKTMGFNLDAA